MNAVPHHPVRVGLIAALSLAVGAAMGTPPPLQPVPEAGMHGKGSPSFAELDRNNDGVLSSDELPADHALAGRVARHDLDGDQAISRAEYDAWLRGGDDIAETGDDDDHPDDDD